jgi:hypothetical protein
MTAFPSPTLAPEVAQRLLADWDSTHDELRTLIVVHQEREWTREEDLQHARLVRHIAVLSTALHGDHHSAPLTPDERAWLAAQGVPHEPPIKRGSTVPKDHLTAAMIERPAWPK